MFWPMIGFCGLASAMVVNKIVMQTLPLTFFVGLRVFLAGIILFLLTFKTSHRLRFNYLKQDWSILLVAALFTTFVPSLLKAYGLKNMLASKWAFIGSLDPFITALIAYIMLSERLTARKALGIIIAFTGALFLCFSSSPVEQSLHAFLFFSWPELAAFASVVLSRYGWTHVQKLLKRDRYTPMEVNAVTMMLSGIFALIVSFFIDNLAAVQITSPLVLASLVAYTIIIGNVFGFTMYGHFLKKHSASFVSITGFSVPILVTCFSWLFLGERLSLNLILSAAIIFVGVYIFYKDEIRSIIK